MSESGAYLIANQKITPETEMIVYVPMQLQGEQKLCMVTGKVIRSEMRGATTLHGHGIHFGSDLSPSSRKLLRNFVAFKTTGELPKDAPSEPASSSSPAIQWPPAAKPRSTKSQRRSPLSEIASSREVRSSHPALKRWVVMAAIWGLLATTIAVLGNVFYRSSKQEIMITGLSEIVPLIHTQIQASELRAQIRNNWLEMTPPAVRDADLLKLGRHLRKENIHRATLLNSQGKELAVIVSDPETGEEPQIQWSN